MKLVRTPKLASFIVAVAATTAALAVPASAQPPCCPTPDTVYTYYSGPDHSQVVGTYYFFGDCGTNSGVETAYYTTKRVVCYRPLS